MSTLVNDVPIPLDVYRTVLGLEDEHHNLICTHHHHHPSSHGQSILSHNDELCENCRHLTDNYWLRFLQEWKMEIITACAQTTPAAHAEHSSNFACAQKLDGMLQYVVAMTDIDIHDPSHRLDVSPLPMGAKGLWYRYPRPEIVEVILGMEKGDIEKIMNRCVRQPPPITFKFLHRDREGDFGGPPVMEKGLKRFLTDPRRVRVDESGAVIPPPYWRSLNEIHKDLAQTMLVGFFNFAFDSDEPLGQTTNDHGLEREVQVYSGLMWLHHILCVEGGLGFDDVVLSKFVRGEDMYMWFEWVFEEGWKNCDSDSDSIIVDPVELVSLFVEMFISESLVDTIRFANITALDIQLKQFFDRHYIYYLNLNHSPEGENHNHNDTDASLATRFISSSFYLNFTHAHAGGGSNSVHILPNDCGPVVPKWLRLDRHAVVRLLGFNVIQGDRDDGGGDGSVDMDMDVDVDVDVDTLTPTDDLMFKSTHSRDREHVKLPERTDMDYIFECEPLFKVWNRGDECGDFWRSASDTHEDLGGCCLAVLGLGLDVGDGEVDERVLRYARYAWSYHLSYATMSFKLLRLLNALTANVASGTFVLENEYCHHASRVVEWLNGNTLPGVDLTHLLGIWEPLLHGANIEEVVLSMPSHLESDSAAALTRNPSIPTGCHLDLNLAASSSSTSVSTPKKESRECGGPDRMKRFLERSERMSPYKPKGTSRKSRKGKERDF